MEASALHTAVEPAGSKDLGWDDAVLFSQVLHMDAATVVKELTTILGRRITTDLAGVKDQRTIVAWMKSGVKSSTVGPSRERLDRLRVALRLALMLAMHENYAVIAAWFSGFNPYLSSHRTPVQVLSDGDLTREIDALLSAARVLVDPTYGSVIVEKRASSNQSHRPVSAQIVQRVATVLSPMMAAYIAGGVSVAVVEEWMKFGEIDALNERKMWIAHQAIDGLEKRVGIEEARSWFVRSGDSITSPTPATLLHDAVLRTIDHVAATLLGDVERQIAS